MRARSCAVARGGIPCVESIAQIGVVWTSLKAELAHCLTELGIVGVELGARGERGNIPRWDRSIAHQELTGERRLEIVDQHSRRLGGEDNLTPNLAEAVVDDGGDSEQQDQCEDGERRRHPPSLAE